MKSKSTHTPGPWTAEESINDYMVVDDNGNRIAGYATKANARLIAAAPDLLAALKLASVWLVNCVPVAAPEGPAPLPAIRAALAKAEI